MRRQGINHVKSSSILEDGKWEAREGHTRPQRYLGCLFTALTWLLDTLEAELLIVYTVEICFVYTLV